MTQEDERYEGFEYFDAMQDALRELQDTAKKLREPAVNILSQLEHCMNSANAHNVAQHHMYVTRAIRVLDSGQRFDVNQITNIIVRAHNFLVAEAHKLDTTVET